MLRASSLGADVRHAIGGAAGLAAGELDTSGYVLTTLQVGVWALLQRRPLEDVLVEVVDRGGDPDTTAAVAGGLLGVRDGVSAIPARWTDRVEYRTRLLGLVPALVAARSPQPAPAG